MKLGLILVFSFCLSACGLLEHRQNTVYQKSSVAAPEQLDVPLTARAEPGLLRKRVLVLPFLDENLSRNKNVRDVARRAVVRELVRTQAFVVINNSDFPEDLAKYLLETNEYDVEKIAKLSASLGVAAVIEGKVLSVRAKRIGDDVGLFRDVKAQVETRVRLRLASTKSGKVLMNEEREAMVQSTTTRFAEYSYSDKYLEEDPHLVSQSVVKAFMGVIGHIVRSVDKIDWEGRIAMINGDRVFINAGRLSGLQLGDVLKVSESGQEVFDPDKGTFIGHVPGRLKGTLEVVSYFGKDGAVTVVRSGSGFEENDLVELY